MPWTATPTVPSSLGESVRKLAKTTFKDTVGSRPADRPLAKSVPVLGGWSVGLPQKQLQAAAKPIMNPGISQLASVPAGQQAEAAVGEKRMSVIHSHTVNEVGTGRLRIRPYNDSKILLKKNSNFKCICSKKVAASPPSKHFLRNYFCTVPVIKNDFDQCLFKIA
jgi:hypothetical protein